MRLQFDLVFPESWPSCFELHPIAFVPSPPESCDRCRGLRPQPLAIQPEEGLQLGPVRPGLLWVDLPNQRPRRPLSADEGILAAHQVEIACPQQPLAIQPEEGLQLGPVRPGLLWVDLPNQRPRR